MESMRHAPKREPPRTQTTKRRKRRRPPRPCPWRRPRDVFAPPKAGAATCLRTEPHNVKTRRCVAVPVGVFGLSHHAGRARTVKVAYYAAYFSGKWCPLKWGVPPLGRPSTSLGAVRPCQEAGRASAVLSARREAVRWWVEPPRRSPRAHVPHTPHSAAFGSVRAGASPSVD